MILAMEKSKGATTARLKLSNGDSFELVFASTGDMRRAFENMCEMSVTFDAADGPNSLERNV